VLDLALAQPLERFAERPVVAFTGVVDALPPDPAAVAWRIEQPDSTDRGAFVARLRQLVDVVGADRLTALVIGPIGEWPTGDGNDDCPAPADVLTELAGELVALRALFLIDALVGVGVDNGSWGRRTFSTNRYVFGSRSLGFVLSIYTPRLPWGQELDRAIDRPLG
jgi:hypothetical protein